MAEIKDLEQVIADWRGDAAVLKSRGHTHDAKLLEDCADQAARSAEDYIRFLDEGSAQLRSGRSIEWLRTQFPKWESDGHARRVNGRRQYRKLIIPQRVNISAAREEGKRVGMKRAS